MNHTLSDSQLESMIKSAVNSSGPLPPDEKFSLLISALRELQERRKADSEPVAEVVSIYGDPEAFGEREIRPLVGIQQMPYGTKLYRHAQPVPVVPYDFDFDRFNDVVWLECVASNPHMHSPTTSIIARVALELNKRILAGNSPVIPDGYRLQPISEYEATCATVNSDEWPQRWVPVSERMPDDDDFVYIWPRPDFGVELHVGQYCECSPKGDGWYAQVYEQNYGIEWYPITVTHWMPLPAAPQEVKGD